MLDQFAYCPFELGLQDDWLDQLKTEALLQPTFYSPYRTCHMLPILTPGGHSLREEIVASREPLGWTRQALQMPQLMDFLQSSVLPWMTPTPRVLILKTEPFSEVLPHVDCSRATVHQRQHKLRIALSGDRKGLWFLDRNGQRKHIDGRHSCYIIDGSQPHGMINHSADHKLTICFGSPWQGAENSDYHVRLEESLRKNSASVVLKKHLIKPEDFELFQEDFERLPENQPDPRDSATQLLTSTST